jgi:Fur family ferric uptake transcriptional regulator
MGTIRKTKSVKTILEIFSIKGEALAAIDLVERLQQEMNKTTVYRILDRLEEIGILHTFKGKDGVRWYAMRNNASSHNHSESHPHFQCYDCGKTMCLNQELLIPTIPNHKVQSAELFLTGQCEDCLS